MKTHTLTDTAAPNAEPPTTSSRVTVLWRLVCKDWSLNRLPLTAYLLGGLAALGVLAVNRETAFYAGSVLLISVVIATGVHLVMMTVVLERQEQTLPFVLSLPVSPKDFTLAKVLANLGAFLLPWSLLLLASLVLISGRAHLPNGLIPFAVVILVELLVAYCVMLAVALVSESQGWTIFAIVICNLFFNFFLYWSSKLPAFTETFEGPIARWNPTVYGFLAAEVAAIALVLGLTFYLQGRKRDFL